MKSEKINSNLSQHILPNSSMMIGVCMTVISIAKVIGLRNGQHRIAEIVAFDSLIFLISALCSYFSMRIESRVGLSGLQERIADITFMVGLALMTVAGFLLAYELA